MLLQGLTTSVYQREWQCHKLAPDRRKKEASYISILITCAQKSNDVAIPDRSFRSKLPDRSYPRRINTSRWACALRAAWVCCCRRRVL